ncbi:hypothetical protein [Streptomyces chattanoogensis]
MEQSAQPRAWTEQPRRGGNRLVSEWDGSDALRLSGSVPLGRIAFTL